MFLIAPDYMCRDNGNISCYPPLSAICYIPVCALNLLLLVHRRIEEEMLRLFIPSHFSASGCACLFALSSFHLSLYVCVLFSFSSVHLLFLVYTMRGTSSGALCAFDCPPRCISLFPFDIGRCCNTEGCCVC